MRHVCSVFVIGFAIASGVLAQDKPLTAQQQLARAIFKELIEINTTDSSGDVTKASEAMAARLRAAGFAQDDVHVVGPSPKKKNLVARLRGTGRAKPILLIADPDVETLRSLKAALMYEPQNAKFKELLAQVEKSKPRVDPFKIR